MQGHYRSRAEGRPRVAGCCDVADPNPRPQLTIARSISGCTFDGFEPSLRLLHKHPSGDTTPSRADIEMTKKVRDAAAAVGIALHDHLPPEMIYERELLICRM